MGYVIGGAYHTQRLSGQAPADSQNAGRAGTQCDGACWQLPVQQIHIRAGLHTFQVNAFTLTSLAGPLPAITCTAVPQGCSQHPDGRCNASVWQVVGNGTC